MARTRIANIVRKVNPGPATRSARKTIPEGEKKVKKPIKLSKKKWGKTNKVKKPYRYRPDSKLL
jgi:hypothetical protein